jgi:hypothetical protein
MSVAFDTLAYANKLKSAGVSEKEAEIHAEAIASVVDERLVTKEHFDTTIKELEYRLTIKLGTVIVAAMTALVALVKLLH